MSLNELTNKKEITNDTLQLTNRSDLNQDEYYNIKEVCDILSIKPHRLRYLEETLDLKIDRDNKSNRCYKKFDIKNLRYILDLKKQGLGYPVIKSMIESKSIDIPEHSDFNLKITEDTIKLFKSLIEESVSKLIISKLDNIENRLEKLEDIDKKLDKIQVTLLNIEKRNESLNKLVLNQVDACYYEVSKLLVAKRELYNKLKKKKLFGLINL